MNRHTTEERGNETKKMAHRALHTLQLTHAQITSQQTSVEILQMSNMLTTLCEG